jgi:hypothetical protein
MQDIDGYAASGMVKVERLLKVLVNEIQIEGGE